MNEIREKVETLRRGWNQIVSELKAEYKRLLEVLAATPDSDTSTKERITAELSEAELLLTEIVGLEEAENITILIEESLNSE